MAYYRPQPSWRDHYNPPRGWSMQRIVAMVEATTHLAYAFFTGQTILQKIPTGYGNLIKRLEYIPPWFWNYDKQTDRWLFNEDALPAVVLREDPLNTPSVQVNQHTFEGLIPKCTPLWLPAD